MFSIEDLVVIYEDSRGEMRPCNEGNEASCSFIDL